MLGLQEKTLMPWLLPDMGGQPSRMEIKVLQRSPAMQEEPITWILLCVLWWISEDRTAR